MSHFLECRGRGSLSGGGDSSSQSIVRGWRACNSSRQGICVCYCHLLLPRRQANHLLCVLTLLKNVWCVSSQVTLLRFGQLINP